MTAEIPDDAAAMRRALELARRGWGKTHPNPLVGAVVVEDGRVVAEGWHAEDGGAHAEVAALRALGRRPSADAALCVTLEPCSTPGRTGACTDAILEAGVRRVVVGTRDPNPAHAGRGPELLRKAGVDVREGVLEGECRDLNLLFNHWMTRGTPLVAMKLAMTLDGKFAAASGHSRWVTGEAARADVMRWRRYFPAIAVGAGTVARDDPRLTSRLGDTVFCPRRLVLDRRLRTLEAGAKACVYGDAHRGRTTVVCGESAPEAGRARLKAAGLHHWVLPERGGHLDWTALRARCAESGLTGVCVEAGPRLATAMLREAAADYAFVYKAPKFLGDASAEGVGESRDTEDMAEALSLSEVRHEVLGDDVVIRGFLPGRKEGA